MRCPCIGCGERQIGCHGSCAGYKAWREADRALRAAIQRDDALDKAALATARGNSRRRRKDDRPQPWSRK